MPSLDAVPPEVLAQIAGLAGAAATLRLEMSARSLQDALRPHEAVQWTDMLLKKWPREGPTLRTLGWPRRVYRAFCTKRRAPNYVNCCLDQEPSSPAGEGQIVFLASIDDRAGIARWNDLPNDFGPSSLRWNCNIRTPMAGHPDFLDDVSFREFCMKNHIFSSRTMASLHVIDTGTDRCATICLNKGVMQCSVRPWDGRYGDIQTASEVKTYLMHWGQDNRNILDIKFYLNFRPSETELLLLDVNVVFNADDNLSSALRGRDFWRRVIRYAHGAQ